MSTDDLTGRASTAEEWAAQCAGIKNPRTKRLAELGIMRSITDRAGTVWLAPNHIEANAKFEAMSADEQREMLVVKDTINGRDPSGAPKVEKHS